MSKTKTGRPRQPPRPWESQLWCALTAQAWFHYDRKYRDADEAFIRRMHAKGIRVSGLYDTDSPAFSKRVAEDALEHADEAHQTIMAAYWRREAARRKG